MKFYYAFLVYLTAPLVVLANPASVMPTILPAGSTPVPAVAAADAPKIHFSHPTFDFHNVDEGPDIIHEFHFRNTGKTTLKISNVSTSCGCTAAVESAKEIPAGGRGTIKATYHTNGRPGHATKFITVTNNDPANPSFQLKLDMTVIREIDLQPDRIYLYGAQHGKGQSTTLKITGKPNMPLKILSAESVNKVVTVTSVTPFVDEKEKRYGATLQVDLPVSQTFGNFTDDILVKTDNKKKPEIHIPVLGEVVGKFQYNPRSLYFMPHQEAPVTVVFNAQEPKTFTIRKVESVHHLVRPYIKKISLGNGIDQYQLVVSVLKNLPKDSDGKDQVIISTNDEEQPSVSIDVQANK